MKKILLSFFLVIQSSFAGLLIEPYLGYGIGLSGDSKITSGSNAFQYDSGVGSGPEYGARLGYSFLGAFAALDYSMSSFKVEDKITGLNGSSLSGYSNNKSEVDEKAMALTVGYELPILLRVWGKYIFNVGWEIEKDKIVSESTPYKSELSGTGIALGAAFTTLPFVNIYAEYKSVKLDEVDSISANGVDVKSSTSGYERERSSITVGVSVPFDL